MTFTLNFGGGGSPLPGKFSSMPGGSGLPISGGGVDQNLQAFQVAAMNNPDLAGIIKTIQGWGGDVTKAIEGVLPKNADGSIDWGKVGKDVAGYISSHAKDILTGLSAYNSYQNQQKANQLGTQAVNDAKTQYATQQPLRDAGMAGMLNPGKNTPDLSQLGKMATAGQALRLAPAGPVGQNLPTIQNVAGQLPAAKPIPLAGAGGPPSTPATPPAPPIPLAPSTPAPYTPGRFGAQPIPLAGTQPQIPGQPVIPPLTPQLPKVGGPVPPKLTLPYATQ